MKKQKYTTGSKVTSYNENPGTEIAQNSINVAKAKFEAESNPYLSGLQMLGQLAMQVGGNMVKPDDKTGKITQNLTSLFNFSTGGKVPIEVEGDEVIETPQGELSEIKGPSHEQGGVNLNVPQGTDIYSKRIRGRDGKTMAERKIAREKNAAKYEKLLKDDPTNKVVKNTLERIKANNAIQEKEDMDIMSVAHTLVSMKEKFATGSTAFKNPFDIFEEEDPISPPKEPDKNVLFNTDGTRGEIVTKEQSKPNLYTVQDEFNKGVTTDNKEDETKQTFWDKFSDAIGKSNLSTGDYIGIAGSLISTFGPYLNTLKERSTDTPNINTFKNFGLDALNSIDKSKEFVKQQEDESLKDLNRDRTTVIKRNRNSAMGVNTQRALDLATDAGVISNTGKIHSQTAQTMANILGQQAQLQNQKDSMIMQGEQARDLADRQDKANFYIQLAHDIANIGNGLQATGKNLNTPRENKLISELFKQLFPHATSIEQ